MKTDLFVNLPVKDLKRSVEFFRNLGFGFEEQFMDENGSQMIVNERAYVMLLREDFFHSFSKKEISDTRITSEIIMALTADNNKEVDEMAGKVEKAGGKVVDRFTEHGEMYGIRFEDLDGHLWEIFHMNMIKMK